MTSLLPNLSIFFCMPHDYVTVTDIWYWILRDIILLLTLSLIKEKQNKWENRSICSNIQSAQNIYRKVYLSFYLSILF